MSEQRQKVELWADGNDVGAANPLPINIVIIGPGLAVDVTDRAARLLGIVYGNLAQLQQLTPADALANPASLLGVGAFPHIWNNATSRWNRWREGAAAGAGLTDPVDRAARLLGVIYGSQAQQLLQRAATFETVVQLNQAGAEVSTANPLPTQDTGTHTNPERWLHDNHWECSEVTISAAGAGGQQNLGAVVGAGVTRRVREITIRHAGTNNTVVTLLIAGGDTKVTIDVPAQTTRVWSSQDGREFAAGEQPAVQSSDVTGGNTYISASGVEA